jgi:hypothetical protein
MKMSEALEIINQLPPRKGFKVKFYHEHSPDAVITEGSFPDIQAGDKLIETEEIAWRLAELFALQTKGKYKCIYVVDEDNNAVEGAGSGGRMFNADE